MKLIFLDIDGVLNHELHYKHRAGEGWEKDEPPHPFDDIDTFAVEMLNYIIEKTKAKVVISSSWRMGREIGELQGILDCMGFEGEIIDKTPLLHFGKLKGYSRSVPRGCEIKAWLEMNKDLLGKGIGKYRSYVILDDDSDMLYWQREMFFRVDSWAGITPDIAHRVINYLNSF